jgi:hypothetical protein
MAHLFKFFEKINVCFLVARAAANALSGFFTRDD